MVDRKNIEVEQNTEEVELAPPPSSIYDVLKALDVFKNLKPVRKLYKVDFNYHRRGEKEQNKISLVIKIRDFKSSKELSDFINSEYFEDLLNTLEDLDVSRYFIRKISNTNNYSLHMVDDVAIFQTKLFKVFYSKIF